MSATLRSLRFYLVIGLLQGLLLMWAVLYSGWSGIAMAAVAAALLMGGGLLQLLPERRHERRIWLAMVALALAAAGTVVACRELPMTGLALAGVSTGLILMTLFGAAVLQGRTNLWRRFFGYALWVALALPLPWIAHALFKAWTFRHYRDPLKGGFLSLVFFAGPTLAFSIGLFLIGLCLAAVLRRRSAAAAC